MRWNGINDGTIKTFLISGLLIANIVVAFSHQSAPWEPLNARASRAVCGALAENFAEPRVVLALGKAPRSAREARALPGPAPRTP